MKYDLLPRADPPAQLLEGGEAAAPSVPLSCWTSSTWQTWPIRQAGSLPYGAQRRLEIMRALATSPKLLLLDEPAAGMNPSETAELTETIRRIRDEFNIAVLLIEHDMSLVMGICEGIARAELRPHHRQGHPGRDPQQSRRSSRPTWARRRAERWQIRC